MKDCAIHVIPDKHCPYCRQNHWQYQHDKRWLQLMVIAVAVGLAMPFPVNVIQTILCGLVAVHKAFRLFCPAAKLD